MSSRWRRTAAVSAVAGLLIAGCGSVAARSPRPAAAAAPPELAAAVTTATGTSWAIVVMGGASSEHDDFWQLFARPAGSVKWRQVTPAGVADNGGLVAGVAGPASLVTGFRPSQDLSFSPLAATADGGASWSAGNLVSPGLADVPDALAAGPGAQLIALTSGGGVQLGTRLGAAWSTLASARSLARTAAARACGLTGLTAVTFGSTAGSGSSGGAGVAGGSGGSGGSGGGGSGVPMLAGGCSRPGIAGIVALRGGRWQAAGPPMPQELAGRKVEILRMATLGARTQAVLQSGTGPAAAVLAAWSDDGGGHWRVSAPLRIAAATVRSASFRTGGGVGLVLGDGAANGGSQGQGGEALAGPGASWRALPALPRWTATLAVGSAGRIDALTAHGSSFADWQLTAGSASWSQAQALNITIPYGSSG